MRLRDAKTRKGHHPREPHQPAVDDPAADLQQDLPGELGDLGAAEEAEVAPPNPSAPPGGNWRWRGVTGARRFNKSDAGGDGSAYTELSTRIC